MSAALADLKLWARKIREEGGLLYGGRVLRHLTLQFRPGVFAIVLTILPEPECDWKWIDVELLPPSRLITRPMKFAVMDPANRDGELVAHSVSQGTRLCKRQVMRIRRHSAAHEARLPSHELPVLLVAQANCFSQSTHCPAARPLLGHCRSFLAIVAGQRASRHHPFVGDGIRRPFSGLAVADRRESRLKSRFDNLGVFRCQAVLGRQIPTGVREAVS